MTCDIKLDLSFISKNSKIGVALSGGRDSIALAFALKQQGENVIAINVEHGIRGDESISDSKFVQEWCKSQRIELLSYSVNAVSFSKENGYTLEQGARILRYNIFDKLLSNNTVDYVALAHHKDDQAETILMRIIRGTGINGLVGMQKINGKYIRPLLDYSREDIDNYIRDNNLQFVEDSTNNDLAYTRNYLRKELQELKNKFPQILDSFSRLSRISKEEKDYIDSLVPNLMQKDNEIFVPVELDSFIFNKAIYKACDLLGVKQDIEEKHIEIINALKSQENGKMANLTHCLAAYKDGANIVFKRLEITNNNEEVSFGIGCYPEYSIKIEKVDKKDIDYSKGLYMDLDKLPQNATIRYRKEKDVICKFGGGKKSLGDYLTDKKIPSRERSTLTVIADGHEVYLVNNVDISSKVKIDENSTNIIKVTKI